jgi:predicted PurR-regulated permease PerM
VSRPQANRAESPASAPSDPDSPMSWTSPKAAAELPFGLPSHSKDVARIILATAAAVFLLRWAQTLFIPLILGLIMAYTLNPLVVWLERVHVPRVVGTTLVMLALVAAGVLATMSLHHQVERILDQVPEAAGKLSAMLRDMAAEPNTIQKVQAAAREVEQATSQAAERQPDAAPPPAPLVVEQPKFKLVDFLWTGSLGMFGLMAETAMLLLLVFFLLCPVTRSNGNCCV